MLRFIDTHTHLYSEEFASEQAEVLKRAIDAGVSKMVLPDIDILTRSSLFDLSDKFPNNCFPCLGLHPCSVNKNWKDEIEDMEKYFHRKIYAIGEVGLDLYWSKEFLDEQIEALGYQIELAHKMNLPLIFHVREATEIMLKVVAKYKHLGLRGVFHAFSGSIETYKEICKLGDWYVGIGGVVTYKKANLSETIKNIPLERILLETDSPYLSPVPKRGKRNESSYIPYIAEKIALEKGCTLEELAETTNKNAENLFSI